MHSISTIIKNTVYKDIKGNFSNVYILTLGLARNTHYRLCQSADETLADILPQSDGWISVHNWVEIGII